MSTTDTRTSTVDPVTPATPFGGVAVNIDGSGPATSTRFGKLLTWIDGPWRFAFVLTVMSLVMWRSVAMSPTTTTVGSGGRDFHFYIWSLDVIARGMFRWGPGLRTSVIYPFEGGVPLTADTTILGFGFLLAPVTRLFGPVVSLNLVMLSALPLNGAAAFWAYRKVLRCEVLGSCLGALLFATSPYVMAHSLGHANLVHLWWFPIAVGLIVPAVTQDGPVGRRRRVLRAALGGAVLGFAMLLGSELVAIAALVTAPWFAVMYVRRRPDIDVAALAAAVLCAVVVSAPIVWGTIGDPNHYTGVHQPPNVFVTDVSNLVVPTADSLIGRVVTPVPLSSRWTGNSTETTGYLSLFGVALIVVALQRRVRAASRPFAGLCAWGVVLSLGPFLHIGGLVTRIPLLPGMVLTVLPLLGSVLPGRISFVIFAALGATVALSFERRSVDASSGSVGVGSAGSVGVGSAGVGSPGVGPSRAVDNGESSFQRRRSLLCKGLAVATVAATLPPFTMSSFQVAATFGLHALSRTACGAGGDVSRAVAVPRDESSYDALSWQVRGNYGVQLVRARYFALDYPLHGRPLALDQFVTNGSAPGPVPAPTAAAASDVVRELRGLSTNCVVGAPALIDPVTRRNLGTLFGPPRRSGGLDYWSVD